jgi:hypothetical protein
MRRWCAIVALAAAMIGCAGEDDDDGSGFSKQPMALEKVPAVVMKTAKEAAPELTFYAAYKDKFNGQDSIELKGKTKSGKIVEVEVSPDGKLLGTE